MAKVIPTASFRRAPRPDPSAVAAFVSLDDAPGDTPVEPPALSIVPEAPSVVEEAEEKTAKKNANRWRRKTLQRADGRELRKQTFYLDAELSHRLMVTCAEKQYELSEAIEEAVNLWLKKTGAR
jgi:hypothetical protein